MLSEFLYLLFRNYCNIILIFNFEAYIISLCLIEIIIPFFVIRVFSFRFNLLVSVNFCYFIILNVTSPIYFAFMTRQFTSCIFCLLFFYDTSFRPS